MSPFSNAFEKRWFAIIMFFYVFIMIPFPFFYTTTYQPVLFGIPNFIFGWVLNALAVIAVLFAWRASCMSRPEYQDDYEGDK